MAFPWLSGAIIEIFIPVLTYIQDGVCFTFPYQAEKSLGVFFFINYLFPLLFMVVCYVSMALRMRNSKSSSQSNKRRATEVNILKTLAIVSTCYALCWFPSQVHFLCFNLGLKVDLYAWYYYVGVTALNFNCMVNPFIYAFKYEAFILGMKQLFNIKQTEVSPTDTTPNTVTTSN